ncbi:MULTISPECIES: ammonium transporter [Shewanella]|jgi:Amt family ammonium transporter|uniref:ammonium transporter n=1 Tax=Shewanella TaxID=22 RepID=UPI0006DAE9F2|nr:MULTISPECIES: ammonium transporter [Shewanella]PZP33686.1 MAG: ammonium transporter [Shewanella oneidensis]KPN76990.1 ammonia channel protein [Shewanella sp. Sh95]MCL1070227.1 ammonium transporter [Shewanella xiamenensis]MCT8864695.1 ammonium transporter [Shewanella xiamenensis]MCT8877152.1 ammonium transporter [Shewanella xiamenensis]
MINPKSKCSYQALLILIASSFTAPVFADEVQLSGANTAWILSSSALVLLMTLPGLALFYGGLVRSKNVLSILMQCFSIAAIASILWFVVGYSIAFDTGNGFIGGLNKAFLASIGRESMSGDIPEPLFMLFQMTFAIITPALIIGGFAERMKFSAVLIFSSTWLLLVYAPITHWVWGGGWLAELGLYDFAGGTVVHITAGVAALVAAKVLGPRRGFLNSAIMPHNLTMTVTGAGMLWVGWFGFNGGSALGANGTAAMAILATHLAASMGAITWAGIEWYKFGKASALGIVTGMVAGLGTITPASGYVGPAGALVIGFLGGVVCFFSTVYIKQKLKIDDSLDVFPVHGVGGILGTLLAGVFSSTQLGIFSGYGFATVNDTMIDQLGVQMIGIAATFSYTAVVTWLLFIVISKLLGGLRVSSEQEVNGLDLSEHEETGYSL